VLMTLSLMFKTIVTVGPVLMRALAGYSMRLAHKAAFAVLYLQTAVALSVGCFVLARRPYQQMQVTSPSDVYSNLSAWAGANPACAAAAAAAVAPLWRPQPAPPHGLARRALHSAGRLERQGRRRCRVSRLCVGGHGSVRATSAGPHYVAHPHHPLPVVPLAVEPALGHVPGPVPLLVACAPTPSLQSLASHAQTAVDFAARGHAGSSISMTSGNLKQSERNSARHGHFLFKNYKWLQK